MKIYRIIGNRLKLKIRKFQGNIAAFTEAARENLKARSFCSPTHPILKSVEQRSEKINQYFKKIPLHCFNIDLMHSDEYKPANKFLDSLTSNFQLLYIVHSRQHTVAPNISSTIFSVTSFQKT